LSGAPELGQVAEGLQNILHNDEKLPGKIGRCGTLFPAPL
jgi:hypothetical protein